MGWEMGAGLGHVAPLLAVARGLREHGHRPVLALRDVVEPAFLLREDPIPVLQAPVWQPPPGHRGRMPATATLADIFVVTGFGDRDRIHAIVAAWDGLIDLVRPKLVVAEFSPGLCLAARGRVPVVAIGNGFALPPSEMETFPPLQPDVKPLARQDDLLASVNRVQRERGAPPLPGLPALFDAEAQFVHALPRANACAPNGRVRRRAASTRSRSPRPSCASCKRWATPEATALRRAPPSGWSSRPHLGKLPDRSLVETRQRLPPQIGVPAEDPPAARDPIRARPLDTGGSPSPAILSGGTPKRT